MASKLQCAFRCLECPEVLIICSEFVKDNSDSAFSSYPPAMSDYLPFYFCAQRPCSPVTAFYSVFGGENSADWQIPIRCALCRDLQPCRLWDCCHSKGCDLNLTCENAFPQRVNTLWPRLHPALTCISISRSIRMNTCTTFCSQKHKVHFCF